LRRHRARAAALLVLVLALGGAVALATGGLSAGSSRTSPVTGRFQLPQPWLGLRSSASPTGLGALVTQVIPGGPADQAGLQQGDVITAINGQPITSPADIAGVVASQDVGAEVLLQINRGGLLQTVGVILASRPTGAP
jgi:S1-C subfamily serine protease